MDPRANGRWLDANDGMDRLVGCGASEPGTLKFILDQLHASNRRTPRSHLRPSRWGLCGMGDREAYITRSGSIEPQAFFLVNAEAHRRLCVCEFVCYLHTFACISQSPHSEFMT